MKLIILAAGKGTRFLPITEETPKALIPILSKPLVEYTLDLCIPHISGIIFVINDKLGHKIKEYYGNQYKNIPILYAIQNNKNLSGTLGALHSARPLIDTEKFAVCNCDDLYVKEDIEKAFAEGYYGVGLSVGEMPYYYHGIDVVDGYIKGFIRHIKSDDLIKDKFMNGFYILNHDIFSFEPVNINNGEAGLPHTLFANLDKMPLREITFSDWVAVDSVDNLKKAENFIKKHTI